MDHKKAMDKIKKCLSLAESSNPNEAANAWRQAQALMRRFNIEHADVLASEVKAVWVKGSMAKVITTWEASLASSVMDAFDCEALRQRRAHPKREGFWVFIGQGSNPEVAAYAFEVLYRQIRNGRRKFLSDRCDGWSEADKRKHVELYSHAWVGALHERVKAFASRNRNDVAIRTYIEREFNVSSEMKMRGGLKDLDKLTMSERYALREGWRDAEDARLHHGMPNEQQAMLPEGV